MQKFYLYHPFEQYRSDPVMRDAAANLRAAGHVIEAEIAGIEKSSLEGCDDDDLLIICCHGERRSAELQLKMTMGENQIVVTKTASVVAKQLDVCGLRKGHEWVLLLSCYAGGYATLDVQENEDASAGAKRVDQLTTVENKRLECMASILAMTMGGRVYKYFSIIVGGFPGKFASDPGVLGAPSFIVARADEGGGQTGVLAELQHIQWFDRHGQNVS